MSAPVPGLPESRGIAWLHALIATMKPAVASDASQRDGLLYGYLFKPETVPRGETTISGTYVRALLEGSWVNGYSFMVR